MKSDEHDEIYGGGFDEDVQKKIKPLGNYSFSVKSGNTVNAKMCVKVRQCETGLNSPRLVYSLPTRSVNNLMMAHLQGRNM